MIFLLHIKYRTGRETTLQFPTPYERALVASCVARWVDEIRCEDRP